MFWSWFSYNLTEFIYVILTIILVILAGMLSAALVGIILMTIAMLMLNTVTAAEKII